MPHVICYARATCGGCSFHSIHNHLYSPPHDIVVDCDVAHCYERGHEATTDGGTVYVGHLKKSISRHSALRAVDGCAPHTEMHGLS